ncbi:MAG: zf-TFIIB domain-containing protein [Patescibacteria group bacterium]
MNCPSCKHELTPSQLGSTVYWACNACHLLWFDNKENDFLSLDETEMLEKKIGKGIFQSKTISCPRDDLPLYKDSYYYRCSSCGGVFTECSGLVKEKTSRAKHYIASRPLTLNQIRSVVVLGAILTFFGANYVILNTLNRKTTIQSQAAELVTNIHIRNVNNSQLALFFTTDRPYVSVVHFRTKTRQWSVYINKEPHMDHFLVFDKPDEQTTAQVTLNDANGTQVSTKDLNINEIR